MVCLTEPELALAQLAQLRSNQSVPVRRVAKAEIGRITSLFTERSLRQTTDAILSTSPRSATNTWVLHRYMTGEETMDSGVGVKQPASALQGPLLAHTG